MAGIMQPRQLEPRAVTGIDPLARVVPLPEGALSRWCRDRAQRGPRSAECVPGR